MTASAYATNRKALRRWAAERLTLAPRHDGGFDARFVYDGSTCSNMGRSLRFFYDVTLGSRDDGYPILAESCVPDEATEGYRFMCRYRMAASDLMSAIGTEAPLIGRQLDEVLHWQRPAMAPSCYCDVENRAHKWGLVLETIHFALSLRDDAGASSVPASANATAP